MDKVKHSQILRAPPLKVWIGAQTGGEIITAPHRMGESCSHVGALLFAVSHHVRIRENTSSTDVLNKWLPPNTNVTLYSPKMCEVLSENQQCPIISSQNISEKETLAQGSNEDEKNKDLVPEVLGKPDSCKTVPAPLLNKLANGVLSIYVNDMKKSSTSLTELIRNQGIVIETLEQENTRVTEALNMYPLEEMFSKVKQYQVKVHLLRKEMLAIHERTTKLKKRAMKLQQQKQKEALQKELQRDRELERDKQLAPKIAPKSMPTK